MELRVSRQLPKIVRPVSPKLGCDGRDIIEQLNYVASQLSGVLRNPGWAVAHERVLHEAVREIKRLRGWHVHCPYCGGETGLTGQCHTHGDLPPASHP